MTHVSFYLSFRDVEELLAQRGITVSYEAIRLWRLKFGPEYARGYCQVRESRHNIVGLKDVPSTNILGSNRP